MTKEEIEQAAQNHADKFKDAGETYYGFIAGVEWLQSENERLKAALEEIVDPIKAMKEKLKDGEKLNGLYAVDLSNNANYLKRIAENALSPQPPKQ